MIYLKITLDTSYFLSGFNIEINPSIPRDCLTQLLRATKISQIYFSEMVIFEANAKISKLYADCHLLKLNIKTKKLLDLPENTKFQMISSTTGELWDISCVLRQFHKDFVDCIHWATSIVNSSEVFVTEDTKLLKLYTHPEKYAEIRNKLKKFKLPKIMPMIKLLEKYI